MSLLSTLIWGRRVPTQGLLANLGQTEWRSPDGRWSDEQDSEPQLGATEWREPDGRWSMPEAPVSLVPFVSRFTRYRSPQSFPPPAAGAGVKPDGATSSLSQGSEPPADPFQRRPSPGKAPRHRRPGPSQAAVEPAPAPPPDQPPAPPPPPTRTGGLAGFLRSVNAPGRDGLSPAERLRLFGYRLQEIYAPQRRR